MFVCVCPCQCSRRRHMQAEVVFMGEEFLKTSRFLKSTHASASHTLTCLARNTTLHFHCLSTSTILTATVFHSLCAFFSSLLITPSLTRLSFPVLYFFSLLITPFFRFHNLNFSYFIFFSCLPPCTFIS